MHQMVQTHRDLYTLLHLKPNAHLSEIKKAYRHAALVAHPDKGGNASAFRAVKLAFEVLSSLASQAPRKPTCTSQSNPCRQRVRPAAFKPRRHHSKRRGLAKCVIGRKRPSTCMQLGTAKRHCSRQSHQFNRQQPISFDSTLEHMRNVLQSMSSPQRSITIQSADPVAKTALLSYMKTCQKPSMGITDRDLKRAQSYDRSKACALTSARSNIRVVKSSLGTRYKAHLVIKGLRLYADATNYEDAIDHHIVFVQMRDAVFVASKDDASIWENPTTLLDIFTRVLNDSATSEEKIGLHVFVYMRATPWLEKNTFITSPVMKLKDAVFLYIRLLSAQKASWDELRLEWIALLQRKRHGKKEAMTQIEAEALVDRARDIALEQQFLRATRSVIRAIKRKALEQKAAHLHAARRERNVKKLKAKTCVLERKAENQQLKMWRLRRQGLKGKDLTTKDLLCGSDNPR